MCSSDLNPWPFIQHYVAGGPNPNQPAQGNPDTGKDWYTSTAVDGIPGPVFWQMVQLWAREDGYTGPIDGDMGPNSWKGIQQGRAKYDGYTGPIDGEPGPNLWKAIQKVAGFGGYQGPIDGDPGPNTYRGLANWLNGRY